MSVSVVIPVYESARILPALLQRVTAVLDGVGGAWEVILVNDGSRDESWKAIQAACASSPGVHGIDLMSNFGQHNALLAGIRAARHDVIVTMDDDLQNPPEEIPALLRALTEGVDVVYGTPAAARHGLARNLASSLTKLALRSAMGVSIAEKVSAFRAFRTQLRDGFADYRSQYVSIDVLLTWGTRRFASVPVKHEPRAEGASTYTLRKLVTHALNMVTGFSVLPLQISSVIGFALALFGFGVLAYVLLRYLALGYSVPGFPFLASIIAIFSGAQLFALGMIGEYLARIHFRVMDRPAYVVRTRLLAGPGGAPEARGSS
ncbi:MAG: glycosyltransferase family 2 protein [Thermoanaerobaculia bacterium]